MSVIAANMLILNPNRILPAAGSKSSVLKHSFAQEILVTFLQNRVVFFKTFASEVEPQLFLACS